MSDEDIGAGVVWNQAVGSRLEAANFGIICATPSALESKWVTFEAGALSKRIGQARVIPYLIGMNAAEIDGPVSMFQSIRADRKGTLELVKALERASPERVDKGSVSDRFDAFWPKLQRVLESLSDIDDSAPIRQEREMLSEILTATRTMSRMAEVSSAVMEFASFDTFGEGDDGRDSEESRRRRDGQARLVRVLPGVMMRFIKGCAGKVPGSEDELLGGLSPLRNDLDWIKDREALLAAYIVVARRVGANPEAIARAVAPIAGAVDVPGAYELAATMLPSVLLSSEPSSRDALQSSSKPARRNRRGP